VAAVRFGPVGASLSLLVTALLAIATALYGWTPLSGIPAEERVLALQVFLIVVGVPLLVLGALIEERRGIVKDLADRLRFEELLSQLSGAFLHSPSPEIGPAFTTWIERVGRFLDVDRATLWRRGYEPPELQVVTFWSRFPGEHPVPALKPSMFPETTRRILGEQPLIWPDIDALPEDLAPERELVRRTGARSLLALPLVTGQGVLGCLALVMIDHVRCWPDEVVQRCRLLADVFASALARQHAESGVRASEAVKSAVLASLASHVAVLDREGRIIAVNESWTRFAIDHGLDPRGAGVGVSYLEVCRRAAAEGVPEVQDSYEGIVEVLAGARADFGLEYRLHSGPEERWFHMTVVPLLRPEGGAVVSHTEVTERRRAEIAAQRSRQELAHTLRVSTIGELTTSLAHELNQPLAAIVANAQAARRTLGARPAEVRQILDDIIEEGKRAGEVIHRLRELLRKGETERAALDVNRLVEDVVKLVGNDVMLRGVTLREELAAETLTTRGDRVQLRQVILNLLMNALEALGEVDHDRRVVVRTEAAPGGMARVSIRDTGPGLRGDAVLVFRPFYTTKEKGMGMGLSIARSILEAHGGTISGRNNPDRGATFDFTLPLVSAGSPERTSPGH
jgi:signal transduction histidine kinase